ncbi:serine hydrolase [uncultured Psychroserpens sp.]|uniref:serine hydrolase domain-containing protein n=1 Tax=uncultured Psychroserpens sp. TaxID=255436 RepID=UPI002624F76E|nr:serine hydrolase domain-containing protein [uncultured Psychroserpens sp.]
MKLKGILIALLLAITIVQAQDEQIQAIDNFISKNFLEFKEIPSLSIAVIKDNKPFFIKSYGYSNFEDSIQATTQSSYYIASVTKSFVGLLAAQLEHDGLLDLDRPITEFAPIKNFKNNSLFQNITITDLLSHTSGIYNNYYTWQFASIGDYTKDDLIRILEDKTRSLENNKSYRYDNFGYNLLDLILSEEYGYYWKDLLEKKIFSPLKLSHTTAYLSKAKKENWDIAQPYTAINQDRLPRIASTRKNDQTFQAAGGMMMSIEDAQQWLLLHMNNGEINGKQIIPKTIIDKAQTSISAYERKGTIFNDTGYGLGWNNAKFETHKAIYHFGGFDGYFSHFSFLPEEKIGIVILVNENHFGDNIANLLASYTYNLLLGNINIDSDYSDHVNKVKDRVTSIQNGFAKDKEKRAKRQWTLMHDFKNYEGDYVNPYIGTLHIETYKNTLKANLGISTAIASPSTSDDSIRVEFRDSRGRDILFISNEEGTVAAVYEGNVFYRK